MNHMSLNLRILYFNGGLFANSVLLRLYGVISDEFIFYPSVLLALVVVQILLYEFLARRK